MSSLSDFPPPNYIDPNTRGDVSVVISVTLYALLLCFVSVRLYTWFWLRCFFVLEDVYLALALMPTTVFVALSVHVQTKLLWTRHVFDIPALVATEGFKMVLVSEIMFIVACMFMKLSVLAFVRMKVGTVSTTWRQITLFANIGVVIQSLVSCAMTLFQCGKPENYWKITDTPSPTCNNQPSSIIVAGVLNNATGFLIIGIFILAVLSSQLSRKRSIAAYLLIVFGSCSTTAGVARTMFLSTAAGSSDKSWDYYPVWIASAVELYIGMITVCVVLTHSFFTTYLRPLLASLPIMNLRSRPRQQPQRHGHVVIIGTGGGDEDLLNVDDSGVGKGASTSTIGSQPSHEGDGDEFLDYIRITQQTVVRVSEVSK